LIGKVGRVKSQEVALHGLVLDVVVGERKLHAGSRLLRYQVPLDGLLFGHRDPGVAFDHRLASQGVARRHILVGQAQGGAAPYGAARGIHHDSAAAAAPLAATGLIQIEAGPSRSVGQQCAAGDLHLDVARFEMDGVRSQNSPPLCRAYQSPFPFAR
jgi:hypothetical protein